MKTRCCSCNGFMHMLHATIIASEWYETKNDDSTVPGVLLLDVLLMRLSLRYYGKLARVATRCDNDRGEFRRLQNLLLADAQFSWPFRCLTCSEWLRERTASFRA